MNGFPAVRLRRLRATDALRRMTGLARPGPEKYVWPVFVTPGKKRREEISSMPGQFRLSTDMLLREREPVAKQGTISFSSRREIYVMSLSLRV